MLVSMDWPHRLARWLQARFVALTSRQRAALAFILSPVLFVVHLVVGVAWGLGWGLGNFANEIRQSWRILFKKATS